MDPLSDEQVTNTRDLLIMDLTSAINAIVEHEYTSARTWLDIAANRCVLLEINSDKWKAYESETTEQDKKWKLEDNRSI